MTKKDAAAVALGRKGGQATSDAKTAAARENGAKGAAARWKDHKPSPKKASAKAGKRKR